MGGTDMEDEKTVTNLSIRAAYDSLEEIVGEKARNIIFKNSNLTALLESPPPYDWNKEFTYKEQLLIYQETIKLIGPVGAQGVIRQIGYKNAYHLEQLKVIDYLKDFAPEERYENCVKLLSVAIGRGRLASDTNGRTVFDVFDCTACDGAKSTKPYCSQYSGALQFFADWSFGKGTYIVLEKKCKAMGDKTCFFELEEK